MSPNWHPLSNSFIFDDVDFSKIEMIFFFNSVYGVSACGLSISVKLATVGFSICDAINANLLASVSTLPNVNQCSTLRNHASMSSVLNGGNGTRADAISTSSSITGGGFAGVLGVVVVAVAAVAFDVDFLLDFLF